MGRFRFKSTHSRMYHPNVPALAALHVRAVTDAAINKYQDTNYISDNEEEDDDDEDK